MAPGCLVGCWLLWLVAAALPAPGAAAPIPEGAFVRVRGTEFVVGDQPFRFVGANIDPMHGDINRPRAAEIIKALPTDGLTVARVWVLGEGLPDATDWSRRFELFRAGPTDFIESSFALLDTVLAEAKKAGVRVILTLSNNWKDYGGAPMYLHWAGLSSEGLGLEEFYRNEKTRAFFRAHLLQVLARKNSLTGVRYVDDPTIFSWELMNESTVLTAEGQKARMAWIAEMAQLIKARDPNHLIAAGLLGYSMRAERAEWIRVHQLPEVDYCDSHLYMQNSEGGISLSRMQQFLDDRAQLAQFVIGKPLVIGEFGFRTDGAPTYLGLPRARWFRELLERLFRDHGSGALVWIYQPYHGKPRDFGIYIDRPDTDDIRATLRRFAERLRQGYSAPPNPRLSAAAKDALLYDPLITLYGPRPLHTAWRRRPANALELSIPVGEYRRARFERTGVWGGQPVAHAYGADAGEYTYRFAAPAAHPAPLAAVEIEARLSSEWPGAVAPVDGGSLIALLLDGRRVAERQVIPDNGLGRRERFTITDSRLLSRLTAGVHTLTFAVPEGPQAHGLCIYGEWRDAEPAPAGEFGNLLIRFLRQP
jgi:mannan endo-1,4-beta-mannosidase